MAKEGTEVVKLDYEYNNIYKLKNKVSVLLPEECSDNGFDNGFPIIRTEKHYNNYVHYTLLMKVLLLNVTF